MNNRIILIVIFMFFSVFSFGESTANEPADAVAEKLRILFEILATKSGAEGYEKALHSMSSDETLSPDENNDLRMQLFKAACLIKTGDFDAGKELIAQRFLDKISAADMRSQYLYVALFFRQEQLSKETLDVLLPIILEGHSGVKIIPSHACADESKKHGIVAIKSDSSKEFRLSKNNLDDGVTPCVSALLPPGAYELRLCCNGKVFSGEKLDIPAWSKLVRTIEFSPTPRKPYDFNIVTPVNGQKLSLSTNNVIQWEGWIPDDKTFYVSIGRIENEYERHMVLHRIPVKTQEFSFSTNNGAIKIQMAPGNHEFSIEIPSADDSSDFCGTSKTIEFVP